MGALSGIRVIDLSFYAQGPFAGVMLAEMGADVIKVEHPATGDPVRGIIERWGVPRTKDVNGRSVHLDADQFNRGKRGITLNLQSEEGAEVFARLLATADVFLTNLREESLLKMGLDYERLSAANPRLVYVLTTGFGTRGSDAGKRCFDPIGMARTGFMFVGHVEGDPDEPRYPVGSLCDLFTAQMTAYATVNALFVRERTGKGQKAETSQLGTMMWAQYDSVYTALVSKAEFRSVPWQQQPNPLYSSYLCADQRWLMIAAFQPDAAWRPLCEAIGRSDLLDDLRFSNISGRKEHAAELRAIIAQAMQEKTALEWENILSERGIVASRINRVTDMVHDPQFWAEEYLIEVDHPVLGRVGQPGYPIRFSDTPMAMQRVAPEIGEHTEEILREIGYSAQEIDELRAAGVA